MPHIPCRAGSRVEAGPLAMAEEPSPASLEKLPPHGPPLDRRGHAVAHHAAPGRPQAERAPENAPERCRQGVRVGQDHQRRPRQIKNGHEGHQPAGGGGHPFHPAQQDQRSDQSQRRPRQGGRQPESAFQAGGDGVHLAQVADAEGGQHAQQGKGPRQHPARQPAAGQSAHPRRKVIHGAAVPAARAVLPVAQAQQVFGVGGHHPEKGRYPHPEDSPRPRR